MRLYMRLTYWYSPDDVGKRRPQRLDLVLDAVLVTQRLHQWRHLVEVVTRHRREQTAPQNARKLKANI